MASENDNMHEDASLDSFSLESILAEYKGSAFINGDKKTPPDILHEKTEEIIREATGPARSVPDRPTGVAGDGAGRRPDKYERTLERAPVSSDFSAAPARGANERARRPAQGAGDTQSRGSQARLPEEQAPRARTPQSRTPQTNIPQSQAPQSQAPQARAPQAQAPQAPQAWAPQAQAPQAQAPEPPPYAPQTAAKPPANDSEEDSVLLFFENYRSPVSEPQDSIAQEVEKAVQRELALDAETDDSVKVDSGMFIYTDEDDDNAGPGEDEAFDEPDLRLAATRFADSLSSISLRCIPAAIISLIMIILTFAFEAGKIIPFGIGRSHVFATGALMLGLLLVMILLVDLIVRGIGSLVRGVPNTETLLLFSCVFSFLSAFFSMLSDSSGVLPYCAVSAFSLTCAAIGERYNLRAITDTLKTATGSNEPYGVQAEYNNEIDKSVLKKAYNRTDGFYSNLMHPDVSETAYRYATPVLLIAALILTIFASLVKGQGKYFFHILSAMFAATAPFSAVLAFAAPFSMVARTIRKSGAAIAGWGGADDICFTDGACVTDDDLFPPGTLSLNGLKLYEGVSPEKAIRYTASLIMASGSGLTHVFSDLLKSQGMRPIRVEDFACYEGGIGALIRGERVATGSAGFMNLLGLRIPDDMNMKNAVYTAVNDKLIAVFAVDYSPANSVQSALISILKWRIKLFFAVRDFNITPSMLEHKFRVSLEDFAYVQAKDSYSISDSFSGKEGRMAAVLTREGFGPFAEAVTGGRLLKSAALVATAVSIVSAALGVIVMFYMFWSGAILSARPGNLLLFMMSMLAAVLIVCGYVKCRK